MGQSSTILHVVPAEHRTVLQDGLLGTQVGQPPSSWHAVPAGQRTVLQSGELGTHLGRPSTMWHSVPSEQRTLEQLGSWGMQWGMPSATWHAVPGGQGLLAHDATGALLSIRTHLGHPRTARHAVPLGHCRSWQDGMRTQRGQPLMILQPVPALQRRFLQEGREMQVGRPCSSMQTVPGGQLTCWQEGGTPAQWAPWHKEGTAETSVGVLGRGAGRARDAARRRGWMGWQRGVPSAMVQDVPLGQRMSLQEGCLGDTIIWTHCGHPSSIWHTVPI